MENYIEEDRYLRAKKRVDKLKGFYWHLFIFVLVNIFISSGKIMSEMDQGESFTESFLQFDTFALWLFWGIGLFFHAFGIFGKHLLFGNSWEERKIKEFMKREELQDKRYN